MGDGAGASKRERLDEFLRRLAEAPAAASHDEAIAQLSALLVAVEDEMTSIPFDPAYPLNDGRMYPPLADSRREVPGRPDLARYRSRAHSTLIGENGAVAILDHLTGRLLFSKAGADGREVEYGGRS